VEELPPPPELPGPWLMGMPASLRLPPAQMQREVCLHVASCTNRGCNTLSLVQLFIIRGGVQPGLFPYQPGFPGSLTSAHASESNGGVCAFAQAQTGTAVAYHLLYMFIRRYAGSKTHSRALHEQILTGRMQRALKFEKF
jgi:hypothetical protein